MRDEIAPPPAAPVVALAKRVGEEIGVSRWFEIAQERINAFAEVTEDRQFIHVDPQAASQTHFGGPVAHGFLTLSLIAAMAEDVLPPIADLISTVNYGFDKLRFVAPVPAGANVRGRFTLAALDRRAPTDWRMRLHVTVEIEGASRPALVADWLTALFFSRAR